MITKRERIEKLETQMHLLRVDVAELRALVLAPPEEQAALLDHHRERVTLCTTLDRAMEHALPYGADGTGQTERR